MEVMEQINDFSDERNKSWCVHCGEWIGNVKISRDHVPSKSLVLKPYPENLPVVLICETCNGKFSPDEEYLSAFLSCVLTGSTKPDIQKIPRAKRILQNSQKLRARIEKSKTEYKTIGGDTQTIWKPEYDRIKRVIVKNARGHAYFEYGEPMLEEPSHVSTVPLDSLTEQERNEFETVDFGGLFPEVGSRMMTRVLTGQDLSDGWIMVQDGVYRYSVVQQGRILVRSVLCEYLATEVFWNY